MAEKMKILIDEMYTGLKDYFEVLGWDIVTVEEANLEGAKDRKIVEYAKDNDLLLITQDRKPADLAELMDVPFVLVSKRSIAKMINSEIKEKYGEEIKGTKNK